MTNPELIDKEQTVAIITKAKGMDLPALVELLATIDKTMQEWMDFRNQIVRIAEAKRNETINNARNN